MTARRKKILEPLRLLILAGPGRSHLEFCLSWRFLKTAAAALLITLALFLGLGGFGAFSTRQVYQGLLARRENAKLKERLASLETELSSAENRLSEAERATSHFAELAGVSPDAIAATSGRGGPAFIGPPAPAALTIPPPPDETLERANFLGLKTMKLLNALPIVEAALVKRQELLDARPAISPVGGGHITNGYGMRLDPFTDEPGFHEGVDIAAPYGSWVRASGNGIVSFAGYRTGFGNVIEITHLGGYITRYAHLSAIRVPAGYKVKRAQVIGTVGSTGRSTGPHCHYEVELGGKHLNPSQFFTLTP
jgi:murein DD-endopeptidase MepM/ murein hydrolase activator NlpD